MSIFSMMEDSSEVEATVFQMGIDLHDKVDGGNVIFSQLTQVSVFPSGDATKNLGMEGFTRPSRMEG